MSLASFQLIINSIQKIVEFTSQDGSIPSVELSVILIAAGTVGKDSIADFLCPQFWKSWGHVAFATSPIYLCACHTFGRFYNWWRVYAKVVNGMVFLQEISWPLCFVFFGGFFPAKQYLQSYAPSAKVYMTWNEKMQPSMPFP